MLAASGCGQDRQVAIDGAKEAVRAYLAAYTARDGAALCATLTSAMRDRYGATRSGCATEATRVTRAVPMGPPCRITSAVGNAGGVIVHAGCETGGGGELYVQREHDRWLLEEDFLCLVPECADVGPGVG